MPTDVLSTTYRRFVQVLFNTYRRFVRYLPTFCSDLSTLCPIPTDALSNTYRRFVRYIPTFCSIPTDVLSNTYRRFVQYLPTFCSDLPTNVTVYWGSSPVASTTANITCYASRGHPPATLSWYKNDVALDTSNAVYTGTTDSSGKSQCVCVCVCGA